MGKADEVASWEVTYGVTVYTASGNEDHTMRDVVKELTSYIGKDVTAVNLEVHWFENGYEGNITISE